MSILGEAKIRTNGKELRSMGGAELSLGGMTREVVKGSGRVHGFREVYTEPTLSLKIAAHADTDWNELQNLQDATVDFDGGPGLRFLLNGAFRTETINVTESDGSFSLNISAFTAEQV